MPGGQPLWAGNFPFVHCTFLFCFAPRKPFALFCRAKKGQKTREAPQAALLCLVLPGSEVLAPALDVRDCPFSGAVPVSGFKRGHGTSPEVPWPWFCRLSAIGRKPPRHVPCLQQQETALVSLSSAQRFPLGKKGACGRLGAVHCPVVAAGQELPDSVQKSRPGTRPFVTRKGRVMCDF